MTPSDNAVISQQILTLNLINTKLSHAYKGLDVEWEDSSKSFLKISTFKTAIFVCIFFYSLTHYSLSIRHLKFFF